MQQQLEAPARCPSSTRLTSMRQLVAQLEAPRTDQGSA
jgi:hypothetical protein